MRYDGNLLVARLKAEGCGKREVAENSEGSRTSSGVKMMRSPARTRDRIARDMAIFSSPRTARAPAANDARQSVGREDDGGVDAPEHVAVEPDRMDERCGHQNNRRNGEPQEQKRETEGVDGSHDRRQNPTPVNTGDGATGHHPHKPANLVEPWPGDESDRRVVAQRYPASRAGSVWPVQLTLRSSRRINHTLKNCCRKARSIAASM